jgi:hypothetical protein
VSPTGDKAKTTGRWQDENRTRMDFRGALLFQELVNVALVDNVGTGVDNRWHLFASREIVHRVYHFYPNFVGTLADQYAGVSFLQEAQLLRQSVERNDY